MTGLRFLVALPLLAYVVSYLYLAWYHKSLFLFNTIVHEGGTYTLLQTIFYFSHFLGHVPVHTMAALVFTGVYLSLTGKDAVLNQEKRTGRLMISLSLFLAGSFFLGLIFFGREDTFSFLLQQKQGVGMYAKGGSWNLHLPSSMLLFALIPVYVYLFKLISGRENRLNSKGLTYILGGFILLIVFTYMINGNIVHTMFKVWSDPRYLAHSVRELMTFPVTYFPITLFILLRNEKADGVIEKNDRGLRYLIIFLAGIFLLGIIFQAYVSLSVGIDNLSQRPYFANSGSLGIPYLLASHYFEHVLDTVYFTLLCLLLHGSAMKAQTIAAAKACRMAN